MFSDEFLAAINEEGAFVGYACELDFPDGISRAHSGVGNVIIDGNTFLGVGSFGSVGRVYEYGDEKSGKVELELSGVPGDVMDSVLTARCRGRAGSLYLLVWNQAGVLIHAECAISGIIAGTGAKCGETNKISVTLGDRFELFDRAINRKWTDESHQHEHAGDRICRYVAQMADRTVHWGSKADATPFKYS